MTVTNNNNETTALVAALERVDRDLRELGECLDAGDERARQSLRDLELDHEVLDKLVSMLPEWQSEVDIFDELGMHGSEEFHSDFLAWLLNPRGKHGLGGQFLRQFLARSGTPRMLRAAERPSTIVKREHQVEGGSGRLDIFICNENAKFVCVVENKVWSGESGNQLAFYRMALGDAYPGFAVHHVFLTRQGEEPVDVSEREYWKRMTYTDIRYLVEECIAANVETANEHVLAFLSQYVLTLRRNIVPDVSNDVHELARQIYRKHQRAIDLIFENKESYRPNYVSEAYRMILEGVDGQPNGLVRGTSNLPYARFLSADWARFEDIRLSGWPNWLLIFEAHITETKVELYLSLAEGGNAVLRRRIFDHVKKNPDVFDCDREFTERFIRLHTVGTILNDSDNDIRWDETETRTRIAERLDLFVQNEFVRINEVITKSLEEYQAGQR